MSRLPLVAHHLPESAEPVPPEKPSSGSRTVVPWYPGATRIATRRTTHLTAAVAPLWHWTGSSGITRRHLELLAEEVREGSGPSWHFGVGRLGNVVQLAPITVGTRHCVGSGIVAGHRGSYNALTLGIELENWGVLSHDERRGWRPVANPHEPADRWAWRGTFVVPESQVSRLQPDGRHYHLFTPAQIRGAADLLAWLAGNLGWTPDVCRLGHRDLDPAQKADPGSWWQESVLPQVLELAFGRRDQLPIGGA